MTSSRGMEPLQPTPLLNSVVRRWATHGGTTLGESSRVGGIPHQRKGGVGHVWGVGSAAWSSVPVHGLVLPLQAGLDQAVDGIQAQALPGVPEFAPVDRELA